MNTHPEKSNIFSNIPERLSEELFQTLADLHCIQIERIISERHSTPPGCWYDQEWDEWVLLLSGSAGILFEDEQKELKLGSGDYLLIPAGCRHRVEWTDPKERTIWLAIHFGRKSADTYE